MNTQHLQYIIEIERTRSISQAAENLYVGQPNLSRLLHDMEERVGFAIFERTSRGVYPTPRGTQFLRHAQTILREAEQIENIGSSRGESNQIRICIPRSEYCMDAVTDYIAELDTRGKLDIVVQETHVRRTINMLSNADADLGIVRYRREYQDYFREQAQKADLHLVPLVDFQYMVTVDRNHALAAKEKVRQSDLVTYTEITHSRDIGGGQDTANKRRIHVVERLGQIVLLKKVAGTYLWMESLPKARLDGYGIVQLPCEDNVQYYRDALVYPRNGGLSTAEQGLLKHLREFFGPGLSEK